MIADTIIRASEANPRDIILHVAPDWLLAFSALEQETDIILWATEAQAQSGADSTDIVVTVISPSTGISSPAVESKLKRWSGTGWIAVGTIVTFR